MSSVASFSHEDDVQLIQNHARYGGNFQSICNEVPCFKGRDSSDLQNHWDELVEPIDTDTSDALEKFKRSANTYGKVSYNYSSETYYEAPTEDEMIDIFKDIPSLTQTSLSGEVPAVSRQDPFSDIKETSFNQMFDAQRTIENVGKSLTHLIADQELRKTMMQEFQQLIYRKGQILFCKDFTSRLNCINEQLDQQDGERETEYLNYIFSKQIEFVKRKAETIHQQVLTKRIASPSHVAAFPEIISIMTLLADGIVWPKTDKPHLNKLKRDCKNMYIMVCSFIMNTMDTEREMMYRGFFDAVVAHTREGEIEKFIKNGRIISFLNERRRIRMEQQKNPNQPQYQQIPSPQHRPAPFPQQNHPQFPQQNQPSFQQQNQSQFQQQNQSSFSQQNQSSFPQQNQPSFQQQNQAPFSQQNQPSFQQQNQPSFSQQNQPQFSQQNQSSFQQQNQSSFQQQNQASFPQQNQAPFSQQNQSQFQQQNQSSFQQQNQSSFQQQNQASFQQQNQPSFPQQNRPQFPQQNQQPFSQQNQPSFQQQNQPSFQQQNQSQFSQQNQPPFSPQNQSPFSQQSQSPFSPQNQSPFSQQNQSPFSPQNQAPFQQQNQPPFQQQNQQQFQQQNQPFFQQQNQQQFQQQNQPPYQDQNGVIQL